MDSIVEKTTTSSSGFTEELKPGTTLLQGQYVVERFLNSGGFGMTYLAKDSLDRPVVIKECFPASLCSRSDKMVRARSPAHQKEFRSIVKLFVQEAMRLSKLKHPNIVGVHQVFEDNDTAYMALDYIDGLDLLDIMEDGKKQFGAEELRTILLKILDAIGFIHSQNILHRDISPDNILMDRKGNPILIDFGAAREKATKATRALSAMVVVKDGYSPQEFYIAGTPQGPASDLYALAATFYHLMTGEPPPNCQTRLAAIAAKRDDPYRSITARVSNFDSGFLAAIDKALSVFPKDRIQSAAEWMDEIDVEKRRAKALAEARRDKNIDLSISILVSETNRAVLEEIQMDDRKDGAKDSAKIPIPQKRKESVLNHAHSQPQPRASQTVVAERGWFARRSTGKRHQSRFWFFGKSRVDQLGKANP